MRTKKEQEAALRKLGNLAVVEPAFDEVLIEWLMEAAMEPVRRQDEEVEAIRRGEQQPNEW